MLTPALGPGPRVLIWSWGSSRATSRSVHLPAPRPASTSGSLTPAPAFSEPFGVSAGVPGETRSSGRPRGCGTGCHRSSANQGRRPGAPCHPRPFCTPSVSWFRTWGQSPLPCTAQAASPLLRRFAGRARHPGPCGRGRWAQCAHSGRASRGQARAGCGVISHAERALRPGPGDGALAGCGGPERPALKQAAVIPTWAARWVPVSRLSGPGRERSRGRTCRPIPTTPALPRARTTPAAIDSGWGGCCQWPLSHCRPRVTGSGLGVAGDLSRC